jgi:hypothetical protein
MHVSEQAWWVSGYYPAALAPADMWIAGAFSAAVIAGIVDAEVTLADELQRMQVMRLLLVLEHECLEEVQSFVVYAAL